MTETYEIPIEDISDKIYLAIALSKAEFKGVRISVSALLDGSPLVNLEKDGQNKQYLIRMSDICEVLVEEFLEDIRETDTREAVAELAHKQWAGWMKYLFSKGTFNEDGTWTMPEEFVRRWTRQAMTPYRKLSPEEQDSDRKEADKFLDLLNLKR